MIKEHSPVQNAQKPAHRVTNRRQFDFGLSSLQPNKDQNTIRNREKVENEQQNLEVKAACGNSSQKPSYFGSLYDGVSKVIRFFSPERTREPANVRVNKESLNKSNLMFRAPPTSKHGDKKSEKLVVPKEKKTETAITHLTVPEEEKSFNLSANIVIGAPTEPS